MVLFVKKLVFSATFALILAIPTVTSAQTTTQTENIPDQSVSSMPNVVLSNYGEKDYSNETLNSMVAHAKNVLEKERAITLQSSNSDEQTSTPPSYAYYSLDPNNSYLYEEPSGGTPQLVLFDNPQSAEQQLAPLASGQTDFISDGVGGRNYIAPSGSSSSYLMSSLQLPVDSYVVPKTAAYNYIGFTNSQYEADLGTVFVTSAGPNSNEKGWRLAFNAKHNGSKLTSSYESGYNEMWDKNAFLSNSSVTMVAWYNYAQTVNSITTHTIRLKITGKATCADHACNNQNDTSLIAIADSPDLGSNAPTSITHWKVLSTVVSTDNTGRNKGIFSNININGTAVPSSSFSAPEQDHALITRTNNNVTIDVDSNTYKL
ncbi:hypothetical protein CJP46_07855 [Paenibacillus sp. XY044]|nr:hypothetical protein CJP46_07855 [Paenibacillus sp. XY044]